MTTPPSDGIALSSEDEAVYTELRAAGLNRQFALKLLGDTSGSAGGDTDAQVQALINSDLASGGSIAQAIAAAIAAQPAPSSTVTTGDASWTPVTYAAGWEDFGTFEAQNASPPSFMAGGFRKDGSGFVHLRGVVRGGSGVIATLPVGYRPASGTIYGVSAGGSFAELRLFGNGQLTFQSGNSGYVGLDGITFLAEN